VDRAVARREHRAHLRALGLLGAVERHLEHQPRERCAARTGGGRKRTSGWP
jgi:hypothetical protein